VTALYGDRRAANAACCSEQSERSEEELRERRVAVLRRPQGIVDFVRCAGGGIGAMDPARIRPILPELVQAGCIGRRAQIPARLNSMRRHNREVDGVGLKRGSGRGQRRVSGQRCESGVCAEDAERPVSRCYASAVAYASAAAEDGYGLALVTGGACTFGWSWFAQQQNKPPVIKRPPIQRGSMREHRLNRNQAGSTTPPLQ